MNLPDTCNGSYCGGNTEFHEKYCLRKTVVLEMTTRIIIAVPRSFDQRMIEFTYNDGTHCVQNHFADLAKATKSVPISKGSSMSTSPNGCGCSCTEYRYLGDADENTKAIDLTKLSPENGQIASE